MPTQPLYVLAAMQGTYVINDTTAWTGKCDAVYTLEDTEFSILNDDNSKDKDDYIADSSAVVKAGCLIRPLEDAQFTAITLTSGSVALVL